MITKDLRRKLPALFDDVKAWLNVLHTVNKIFVSIKISNQYFLIQYYPGSDSMKNFLYDLTVFMNNRTTITGKDLQNYINSTSVCLI